MKKKLMDRVPPSNLSVTPVVPAPDAWHNYFYLPFSQTHDALMSVMKLIFGPSDSVCNNSSHSTRYQMVQILVLSEISNTILSLVVLYRFDTRPSEGPSSPNYPASGLPQNIPPPLPLKAFVFITAHMTIDN